MTRVRFLVAALLLAGCGESERTRFTPATPGAKSDAPGEPSRGASEVAIPRNIETH